MPFTGSGLSPWLKQMLTRNETPRLWKEWRDKADKADKVTGSKHKKQVREEKKQKDLTKKDLKTCEFPWNMQKKCKMRVSEMCSAILISRCLEWQVVFHKWCDALKFSKFVGREFQSKMTDLCKSWSCEACASADVDLCRLMILM